MKGKTMKHYLVSQGGDELLGDNPRMVAADSEAQALKRYLTEFVAFEEFFRDIFLVGEDRFPSFDEQFLPAWCFDSSIDEPPEPDMAEVVAKMRRFFKNYPDLGESYIRHYESDGREPLTEANFVELALLFGPKMCEVQVIDLDSIEVLP